MTIFRCSKRSFFNIYNTDILLLSPHVAMWRPLAHLCYGVKGVWPYPKKTRNPEKDFIFNRILFKTVCYYNPILYVSMCSKHVSASMFYVNYCNTAYSSLVCSVPDLLSFCTNAPPGKLNIISLLGLSANTIHDWIGIVGSRLGQRRRQWTNIEPTMGECLVFAGLLLG